VPSCSSKSNTTPAPVGY